MCTRETQWSGAQTEGVWGLASEMSKEEVTKISQGHREGSAIEAEARR